MALDLIVARQFLSFGCVSAETVDKETTIAEPNDYITATRKNFVTNDNEGRMVEKCIVEIQGAFLVKIRDYAFNGNIRENAFKHIDKFLEVVGPIKINGLTQDRFRLSDNMVERFIMKFHHLSDHDEEEETEEDDNPNEMDNVPEIFKIEGNLFDFETPLNGSSRKHNLFPGSQVGDATPGVMKFCGWLKNSFKNFHKLDYDVLVKLQECWWKVNAHEIALFTRMENFGRRPYANIKTEWASDPYLDVNRIFGRHYEACNFGNTQENQGHEEHKDDPNPEPSNCKIRRFKMMKYSFDDDEEYITIKESKFLNHSKDKGLEACPALQRQILETMSNRSHLLKLIFLGYVVSDVVHTPYRACSIGAYFLKQSLSQDDYKTSPVMIGERHKM
ncbi:hypothetical protein Tco_1219897 [Tanacetum coccineum]